MYVPAPFHEPAGPRLTAFVRQHSFATLVTSSVEANGRSTPFASHLPLLLDTSRGPQGVLRGHMARANRQWRHFRPESEVLAIFQGPHAFVSSNWYEKPADMVPTWNYAVVHGYGTPRLLEDEDAVYALLEDMLAVYQPEGNPLPLRPATTRVQNLVQAIIGFEIDVTRWEGKFKLSQNRSASDRQRVHDHLTARGGTDDLAVAELMRSVES